MIKNIIFDFDGVLVDSEILVARAFSRYLNDLGHNYDEELIFEFAGKKTVELVSFLSEKFLIKNKEEFFNNIMDIATSIYSNELTTVDGSYEYVKNSKRELFIGSNSLKQRIIEGLNHVKLNNYIKEDRVFSFDMVKRPKPFPDIYLEVIDKFNLDKDQTVIIEDSVVGVQAGKAAGIKVIGLTAGGHWHAGRTEHELIQSGALKVINNYNSLDKIIDFL